MLVTPVVLSILSVAIPLWWGISEIIKQLTRIADALEETDIADALEETEEEGEK